MASVLLVDDDRTVRHLISEAFDGSDIQVLAAKTADEGLAMLEKHDPDVVLLDIMLSDESGLDLFGQIHARDTKLPIIFITALDSSDTAIQAMKLGAYDYLLKPLDLARVQELVRQAVQIRRLMSVPVELPGGTRSEPKGGGDALVGRSPAMQDVYKGIGRVAQQDVTVLIHGESGTGKELVARAIYHHSARSRGPFLAVNCAAIPDSLLESELFGHEKGSFTGADSRRIGKFEQCSGGTLFLDEIGDMSPMVQSKMLRILQEKEFERVGSNQVIKADVRVIAATHRDLEKMVELGTFRADLYYRLSAFTLTLPSLRERPDDLLLLLEHFLEVYSRELHKDVQGISPEALDLLLQYRWPGNVRELQNVLKHALLQAAGPVLIADFFPAKLRHAETTDLPADLGDAIDADIPAFIEQRLRADSTNLYAETLGMMERLLVARVLREADGNQSKAAKILGITRGSLRNKIRSLGVSIDRMVKVDGDVEAEPASSS
ncbi:MAG TPA: sigma-54 dependent transcriptional regulator [Pirellulales bacterium]|jgi:two-component system nitrogen regulation response regulator GlnG|nr:sigma-54 dependent transcriptional regulator [Pirellulales bacterium]